MAPNSLGLLHIGWYRTTYFAWQPKRDPPRFGSGQIFCPFSAHSPTDRELEIYQHREKITLGRMTSKSSSGITLELTRVQLYDSRVSCFGRSGQNVSMIFFTSTGLVLICSSSTTGYVRLFSVATCVFLTISVFSILTAVVFNFCWCWLTAYNSVDLLSVISCDFVSVGG